MELITIIGVVFGIVLLYVATMFLNNATPVPESCKQAYQEANSCDSSATEGCSIKETIEFIKEARL